MLYIFTLFCRKICFVAKSVLSQNLFCRDLRAFVWRKIEPKIVLVEKKRQISGMVVDSGIQLKYCYRGGDRDASGVSYADADVVSCIITKLAMNFHTYMNACYSDNTVVFQRL